MKLSAKKIAYSLLAASPMVLFAFSTGPVAMRTGAPVDGGLDCTQCHRTFAPANSDPTGGISIDAANYTPGVKQTIKVTVKHPQAMRWGFQLTARLTSDEKTEAGTMSTNTIVRVRCTNAADAPCNGGLEFAEHNDAPFTNSGAGFTFQVDWTPPSTDSGDVVFYAAGNAANGDATLNGDHIYTTKRVISADTCNVTGKPVVSGLVNAASFAPSMAPNAIVTIFGQNLAASGTNRIVGSGDFVNNAFPKQMSCVAVEIDGKRAPITFVTPGQINVQAPTNASLGPVSVKVFLNPDKANQSASDATTVSVTNLAPGFFTFNQKSVAAQFAGSADLVADPAVVPGARFAKPGDIVTLYGTGFGPTNPSVQAGDVAAVIANCTNVPVVSIGGVALAPADVLYAGLSPQSISGLYQFNVRVPATAPDGDLPLTIQIAGVTTQSGVTIPVKR